MIEADKYSPVRGAQIRPKTTSNTYCDWNTRFSGRWNRGQLEGSQVLINVLVFHCGEIAVNL